MDKIHDIEDCRKDILKAIKKAYTIIKIDGVEEIEYNGVEITHDCVLGLTNNIQESLTKESLEYHRERGRDTMDVLLAKLFQLGYQNGYIMATNAAATKRFEGLYYDALEHIEKLEEEIVRLKNQK